MAVQRTGSAASVHPVSDDVDEPSDATPSAEVPDDPATTDPPTERPAEPTAPPAPSEPVVAYELFDLHETGQIRGDVAQARHTAEVMLYIARVSEALGLHMGAGSLETIEVFGGDSAHAVVTTDVDCSLAVSGCLSTTGTPPEQLREWHRTRTRS